MLMQWMCQGKNAGKPTGGGEIQDKMTGPSVNMVLISGGIGRNVLA